jgi:ketosteroid isomerase-like protein
MRIFMPALAAILATALAAAPAHAVPATEAARQELHGAVAAMDAAWDRKDLTTWVTLFDREATIQAGPSAVLEGQAAIRTFFGRDFERRRGTMRHVSHPHRIDMVAPGLALVDKLVCIEQQDGNGGWKALLTFSNSTLMTRVQGAWKVRAVRAHIVPNT